MEHARFLTATCCIWTSPFEFSHALTHSHYSVASTWSSWVLGSALQKGLRDREYVCIYCLLCSRHCWALGCWVCHLTLRTRSHDSQARRTDFTNKRKHGILCHMPQHTLLHYLHVSHTAVPDHSSMIWAEIAWPLFLSNAGCGLILKSPFLRGVLILKKKKSNFKVFTRSKYTISTYIYSQTQHVQNSSKGASFKCHVQSPKHETGLNFHPLSFTLHYSVMR